MLSEREIASVVSCPSCHSAFQTTLLILKYWVAIMYFETEVNLSQQKANNFYRSQVCSISK